ncbi:hypothetical protein ACIBCM_13965 [Streptomyces sp. NPDC051018]|uniref:hypothetical protein n=1 Tax=Streptomyces sp. NPDC051018 TaxID=3365639 RepID=UPI00378937DE
MADRLPEPPGHPGSNRFPEFPDGSGRFDHPDSTEFHEEEHLRMLFSRAAEPTDRAPAPGSAFTARARRGLTRRRLAVVGTTAAALITATTITALSADTGKGGEATLPAAEQKCLSDTVQKLKRLEMGGSATLYGSFRNEKSPAQKGKPGSSWSALYEGTVWSTEAPYPTKRWEKVELNLSSPPKDGRYLMNVFLEDTGGTQGSSVRVLRFSNPVLPLSADNKVLLTCAAGGTMTVDLKTLRAAGA